MGDAKQKLMDTWNSLWQSIVDDVIDEWHKKLQTSIDEKGGHFWNASCNFKVQIQTDYVDKLGIF